MAKFRDDILFDSLNSKERSQYIDKHFNILYSLAQHFKSHGYTLYAVGGFVRDLFLGHKTKDIDCTTNATPQDIQKICSHVLPTGIQHGTVTILWNGEAIEVTTHRAEGTYHDSRHPDEVTLQVSLEEDLHRRDITINALALDPLTGDIFDLFDGKTHIKNKIIDCVGDPHTRLKEDALRILRLIRFAVTLDFKITDASFKALGDCAKEIVHISKERIKDELDKMFASSHPDQAITLLYETKVYTYIFNAHNSFDIHMPLLSRAMQVTKKSDTFNITDKELLLLRYSLMFILAEPPCPTPQLIPKKISSEPADVITKNLRFTNKQNRAITSLVAHSHLPAHKINHNYVESKCQKRLRILKALLKEYTHMHLVLQIYLAQNLPENTQKAFELFCKLPEQDYISSSQDLAISSAGLISIKNKNPGKWLGQLQKSLIRFVVIHPHKNTESELIKYAQKLQIKN